MLVTVDIVDKMLGKMMDSSDFSLYLIESNLFYSFEGNRRIGSNEFFFINRVKFFGYSGENSVNADADISKFNLACTNKKCVFILNEECHAISKKNIALPDDNCVIYHSNDRFAELILINESTNRIAPTKLPLASNMSTQLKAIALSIGMSLNPSIKSSISKMEVSCSVDI